MSTTESIWEEFHGKLFHFIKKRVHQTEIANDILQDVFVKIHLKLSTLNNEDKLTSWIYQIARNSILDYFKKEKKESPLEKDIPDLEESENFNSELLNCLQPFIEQLPSNYKEAILQTELGDLSQKEFAEKLGISYSGAKSRVQRAREQLNTLFNQCCTIHADKYGNVFEHQCNKNCGCS